MVSTDTVLLSLVQVFTLIPSGTGNYFSLFFILLNIIHPSTFTLSKLLLLLRVNLAGTLERQRLSQRRISLSYSLPTLK
jgi:hypothetical protein